MHAMTFSSCKLQQIPCSSGDRSLVTASLTLPAHAALPRQAQQTKFPSDNYASATHTLCVLPGSMLVRSKKGVLACLAELSGSTRRPSFSNWSMLSCRTSPRRDPSWSCCTQCARTSHDQRQHLKSVTVIINPQDPREQGTLQATGAYCGQEIVAKSEQDWELLSMVHDKTALCHALQLQDKRERETAQGLPGRQLLLYGTV